MIILGSLFDESTIYKGRLKMSKVCDICGKKPTVGNNVSHSQRKTKRRFLPNLQTVKLDSKKSTVCTSCLRTLAKTI